MAGFLGSKQQRVARLIDCDYVSADYMITDYI